jgi:hypothetical protein
VTPALVNLVWAGVPTTGANAVTAYVVEAGTVSGLSNVASTDTGTTDVTFASPAANGTYFVRIRSKNACGLSAPSPEVVVTVTGGTAPGQPGARVIVANSTWTTDVFGNAYVTGEVRGAWGSRPAPFVEVDVEFRNSAGLLLGRDSNFVSGRSRRAVISRVLTDTTLAGGESGCFSIFTTVRASQVASVSLSTGWTTSELEPLRGVVAAENVRLEADAFRDLKVSGTLRNAGLVLTYFNQAVVDVRNSRNVVLDCDFTFVDGTAVRLPSGTISETGLLPAQSGPFVAFTSVTYADVARVVTWPQWEENDVASVTAPSVSWQTLAQQEAAPRDARGRAGARRAAIARLRQLDAAASW